MDALWLDVRYAFRTLIQRPGFLAVAVLTLGLGAGANAAIFSVVNAVLLRPLPYPDGDAIVRIIQNRPASASPGGLPARLPAISTEDLQVWRTRTTTLSQMAAYGPLSLTLTGTEAPIRIAAARVSPALFPLLGVAPLKGRTFEDGTDRAGADAVVVLSFTAWQKYFAADPDILSRVITLDGRGYQVAGVMPRGFEFPDSHTEAWVPFVLAPAVSVPGQRMIQLVQVIARVKRGVSIERAQAEANVIFRQLRDDQSRAEAEFRRGGPGPNVMMRRGGPGRGGPGPGGEKRDALGPRENVPGRGPALERTDAPAVPTVELAGMKDELVRPVRPALLMLLASVGFVLLIACANVANLLLARAAGRQTEIAVRAALGAGRARLIRQVFTESLVLALMGGALGTVLAWGGVQALRALGPADIPRLDQIRLDLPFFAFALGMSVATGLLFGIAPALRLSRTSEMQAIKQGAALPASGLRLFGRNRTRSALAMAEMSLAMMLLVGAGLLIHSFLELSNVNPGYDPRNVLSFQLAVPPGRPPAERQALYDRLLERLSALPGVTSAALSNTLPLQPGIVRVGVGIQGRPEPTRPEEMTAADIRVVSPGYLSAMGIKLTAGRNLAERSGEDQPRELLVNQSFASRYLEGSAVGQHVNIDGPEPWEIVGVVNDVRHAGLTADPFPEIYVDTRQTASVLPRGLGNVFFTVRSSSSPLPLLSTVRGLVRQMDPQLVPDNIATMEQRLSDSVARPRFYALLIGVFAFVAVALAAVGVYGVLSYAVSQCTREIGIRLALGAPRRGVLKLVLVQGSGIAAAGIVIGLAGAALLTRSLASLLFGVTPFDPATIAGGAVVLSAVALVACYLPARRAMRVDPIVALRAE